MNCWDSLPPLFVERLHSIAANKRLNEILQSFCEEKPVSFRVNTLKTTKEHVLSILTKLSINPTAVEWCKNAFVVERKNAKLIDNTLVKNGFIYFQGLSSMLASNILDPKPNESVLDMAAAPGSKTTHIAQLMNNTGTIVANDISRQRLFKLKIITNLLGVSNVKILQIPGEFIWKKYPNYFDKVLVDAPCTMEGRFKSSDRNSFKDWSAKKIKVLSYLQKRLLRSAFYATKPGGTIVYSTCTLSPEENEEIINWLVLMEKSHLTVEKLDYTFDNPLKKWKNIVFHKEIEKTLRIFPTKTMEGFFLAKLKRKS